VGNFKMKNEEDKPIEFIQDLDVLGQPKTNLPLTDNSLPAIPPEEQSTPKTKPRNPFIAFLLSIFTPGLGQIYNGQSKKAILFFSLLLINPLVFGLMRGTTFFYGLIAVLIIEISLRIFIIVDAIKYARRQKEYIPKNYNIWYKHLLIACAMIVVLNIYDTNSILGTQTFTISSTANEPTLQVSDWVVGDMKIYENKQPGYGDIIIYEMNGLFYPGRIVGLPNDELEIDNNIVSINGKQSKVIFIQETFSGPTPVLEFEEKLPNGHKHHIYKFKRPLDSTKTTIKNILVPEGYYYILGDNRNNALDSRYIGFIPKENIAGQLIFSYWGKTKDRINIDFRNK
jgi:signal peptidase I